MLGQKIIDQLKQIKRIRFEIRSVWLFRLIIVMGLTPYALATVAWCWSMLTATHDGWVIPMIDSCLRISEKIFAPAAVTAALNLVPRVRDDNGDGVPDVDEKKDGDVNDQRN